MPDIRVLATMKNEGVHVLEWLAYHRLLGVDRFLIYTNDNDDRTVELFRALDRFDWFEWVDNDNSPGPTPQIYAYRSAFARLHDTGDWVVVIDADEFVALPGNERLPDFLARYEDHDAITLFWKMFGGDGRIRRGTGLTIENATTWTGPRKVSRAECKTIVRMNGNWLNLRVHRPRTTPKRRADLRWIDGSGQPALLTEMAPDTDPFVIGSVHHYHARCLGDFAVRRLRGRGSDLDERDRFSLQRYRKIEFGPHRTEALAARAGAVRAEMARIAEAAGIGPLLDQMQADYDQAEAAALDQWRAEHPPVDAFIRARTPSRGGLLHRLKRLFRPDARSPDPQPDPRRAAPGTPRL